MKGDSRMVRALVLTMTLALAVNRARGEVLLSTVNINATNYNSGGYPYPDRIRVFFGFPTEDRFLFDASALGVTQRADFVRPLFNGVNSFWQNGVSDTKLDIRLSGDSDVRAVISDSQLFDDPGQYSFSTNGGTFTTMPAVSPVSVDLHNLNLHTTGFAVTVNSYENYIVTQGSDRRFTTTVDFDFQVFGDVGALPEPSTAVLMLLGCVPLLGRRRVA